MKRPYEPTIECDQDGAFSVNDPEPAERLVRNPMTGQPQAVQESPETKISRMLVQSLREPSARPSGSPGRIPAHLRRYV